MWYPQNKVPYWWKRQSMDIIDIIWYGIFNNTNIAYMARRIQYCLQLSSKRIMLKWAKPFVRNLCSLFRGLGPQRNNQICRIVRLPPHCGSGEIGGISLDVVDQFLVIVVAKQIILWSAEMITFFNELWSKRGMNGLCSSDSQMSGSDIFIKNLKCWVILEGKMAKCPRTADGRSAKQIPGHQRGQNYDWHRPWGVLCWVWYGWKLTSAHWHHADWSRVFRIIFAPPTSLLCVILCCY
jgi:hypothetical protein